MRQSPLHAVHSELGARFVDFAGWEMPISYEGIKAEHQATRTAAALFDVSHMGRLAIRGDQAADFLDHVCTRRIADMVVGQCRYSHVCREDGGILDDVIVSRRKADHLVVCNASNREKIVTWFQQHAESFETEIVDETFDTVMAAVQGPKAFELVKSLLPLNFDGLKRYHFIGGSMMGVSYYIARSGYTGEDGLEVILPKAFGKMAVEKLLSKTAENGIPIKPAGLGARDTLRLEAGMPLYGHELSEDWDSISAGQKWCCDLSKDFIGVEKLRKIAEQGPERKLVGLELEGQRIARQDATVLDNDTPVGTVTSGTMSPTLDKVIAMGLVSVTAAEVGTRLQIDIRGKQSNATVVKLPFYKTAN